MCTARLAELASSSVERNMFLSASKDPIPIPLYTIDLLLTFWLDRAYLLLPLPTFGSRLVRYVKLGHIAWRNLRCQNTTRLVGYRYMECRSRSRSGWNTDQQEFTFRFGCDRLLLLLRSWRISHMEGLDTTWWYLRYQSSVLSGNLHL